MPVYKAPVEDVKFLLNDVFNIERYNNLPGFADATPDIIDAILEEAAKLCEEVLQPLNRSGDMEGCKRSADGTVTTPKGFKDAHAAYANGGWIGLAVPEAYGGQGLPYTLGAVMNEFASAANMAFSMYPGLTMGAIAALLVHGSEEQKQLFVPRMVDGTWSGTMNLTEPHCGTDLGLIKTKAVPNGDGSYSISGTKIFISAGEQDITQNIIHLVLARIEGAPAGVKGISLFVVPRNHIDADGTSGERNGVTCGSIEHKMGIHGNSTCVMNYDGAKGWLIGTENKGLNAMFVMMNEARLGVAIQGLSQSEVAYQNAVVYAKDRLQGRALTGPKSPEKAADPIIVHPDVRRNLMSIKAFNEAARAFVVWNALKSDIAHRSGDAAERQAADDQLGLMTPILKGVLTDVGFDNAVKAQQMYGGHGYIAEWGMEQFVRDSRIAMIYEGANGVQAMDLCGRKLAANGGKAIQAFFAMIDEEVAAGKQVPELKDMAERLEKALGEQKAATMWFMQNAMANLNHLGAGAHHYMHIMGIVTLGFFWLKMAKVSLAKLAGASEDKAFYEAKLVSANYYAERFLPDAGALRRKLEAGSEYMMKLPAEAFATAA